MIIIAHRGNINGPAEENHPAQILRAAQLFDVELDVWCVDGRLYLGHDIPQHAIDNAFLRNDRLWCHAKNLAALEFLLNNNMHCFWHQSDRYTLTSRGYIWVYPGEHIDHKGVLVVRGTPVASDMRGDGICTDYPLMCQ